jgi:S-adenosyl-L-methionine hydrolase (adenosine-forming)
LITLTTDFGPTAYVGAMKGVIASIHADARVIDLTHAIRRGDVRQGAFALASAVPYFPTAIHVGVVDPGVGAGRKGLAIRCERGVLVGPDNGLLVPPARTLGWIEAREISNRALSLPEISGTFHGRDVFAPTAAHLSAGVPFETVGPVTERFVDLDFGIPRVDGGAIVGEVLTLDTFGNLVTNIPDAFARDFALGGAVRIDVGGTRHDASFVPSYGFVGEGEWALVVGSAGMLEIAVNRKSAADETGAGSGSPVRLERG